MAIKIAIIDTETGHELHADELEVSEGSVCESCGETTESTPDEFEARYECGACGENFLRSESADGDSSRCPGCNKFAGKIAAHACPECDDGEMVAAELVICPKCDDLVVVDDFGDHYGECRG